MTADKIPDDVKVLVVIHPKGITDAAQYAIDQFVLRGGKLIAFLDPLAAARCGGGGPMGGGSSSTMDKLLKAWGLAFDQTKVIADMNYVARLQQGNMPAVLELTETAVNKDDVLTAGTDNLLILVRRRFHRHAGGRIEANRAHRNSSKKSQLVDPMMAQMGGEQITKSFRSSGTEYRSPCGSRAEFKIRIPRRKTEGARTQPEPGNPPRRSRRNRPSRPQGIKRGRRGDARRRLGT